MEIPYKYKEPKFKILIDYLKEEIYNDYNNMKILQYENNFDSSERIIHRTDWELYMLNNKVNINFFMWLEIWCNDNNINFSFEKQILNTVNNVDTGMKLSKKNYF